MLIKYLTLVLLGLTLSTQFAVQGEDETETINYRLPDSINPVHYDLYLHPDIETGNFSGQVVIQVTTVTAITEIVLHSNNLEISNVYLSNTNNPTVFVKNYSLDSVREFLVIELSEELAAGLTFRVGILFGGSMAGKIVGLYSSSYTKADKSKKVIATSKFEPTYARQAFPCFDEPAKKANFTVTLVTPSEGDYHALSNMDILNESYQGKYTEVYFNTSVPMSTYLACFIISDFTYKSAAIETNDIGVPFTLRVFATPEQIDKVDFALEVGKGVMEFYIQYFQIEYPLPKMDMIAIPDFVSGAMEHWGLVTYRETALLYDENTSSSANRQSIAQVIAHEFSHMWFGNLVTMQWWNDLWLNEGFARYMENKGINAIYPEWQMLDQFIVVRLHDVLILDATLGSHPIVQTVESPAEITEIFDTITYGKGASIIRMLEDFIGADNFQKAVSNYLNEFKFNNAVTEDFLNEVQKLITDIDVKSILQTWTVQMGFPVVNVEQLSTTQYRLTQKRFFSNPNDYSSQVDDSPYNYTWSIPITILVNDLPVQRAWFLHNSTYLDITLDTPPQWIKFNTDQVGLYRVNYPDELWKNLANELLSDPSTFSRGDRAHLLNDAFSLADATQLSYDIALDLTKYLVNERDYIPWRVVVTKLLSLKSALMYSETYINFKQYARQLITPIYEELGWELGEDHLENRFRSMVLSAACSLGVEACLQDAAVHFKAWLANPTVRPHPDLRETVYYYGMMTVGDESSWDAMYELFVAEEDATEKLKLMNGLAAVQVPWILSAYITLGWSEDVVRGQDYFNFLIYIASNPVGEPLVWEFVREEWPTLVARFGINERTLGNLIPSITARFDTQTKLEDMEFFFAKYPEAGAGAAARVRAQETVKNNIEWLKNNDKVIANWLENCATNMIITTKLVAICLGLALVAFTTSTIVLAVQKANLQDELDALKDSLTTTTTTTTTTTVVTPTTASTSSQPATTPTTTIPAVTTTTALPDTTTTAPEIIDYRLPDSVFPINYNLYLHPDIETGNFTGQMLIRVNTTRSIDKIVLHSSKLVINNVYLSSTNNPTVYVKNYYLDLVREFLVIELSEELPAERAFYVGILFEGTMAGKIVGLYSSSYLKADNTRKYIATSKFEPTYARLAFPCFDEPALKATFDVTLVYPSEGDYHALSNMDIAGESYQGKYTEVYFNRSVPMSTYLACFIVSDFEYKSAVIDTNGIGNPFTLRAFATPEQLDKVDFALDVGKTVIEYYIQYFQVEYPLPKLDMAAIPDFVSGAMEHWGLVTYRETSLLYDEAVSSTVNKQRVASVIAHEFAHMWFGNLVTMDWWNDLWLNEGFASYIEDKGVEAKFPEWKMRDQFITGTLHPVLTLDATLGAHPIIQTVANPDQITEIFDTITYSKGASLIRMLEDFIEPDNFQKAVTNYLNEYKYKNAVTDNFLTEIEKLNLGFDVKSIMNTWTEQMGLPVVEVEQISTTQYKLTQKRFFSNPDDYEGVYDDSAFNYTWSIPITYKTNTLTDVNRAWFYYNESELIIELSAAPQWIKFNYDQIGYYRVNYPAALWENLANQLIDDPTKFSVGDRAGLLNDAFTLADATQLSYDTALDMTAYLAKEVDYVPWSVAASKLTSLKRLLMFTEVFGDYKQYARELIKPIYENVTWTVGEDHLQNRLRVTILAAACSLGLDDCLNEASTRFNAWLANPDTRPHPDIRETIYYYGAFAANESAWQTMWDLFVSEADASEKSKLMYGLSAVQVPWILGNYINLAWDENNVRGQDYFTCIQYIAANPVGEPIVWDYVREHWPDLVDRFGLNERYLGSMIPSITARFDSQTKLEEMQQFFAKYPEAGAGAAARVRAQETVKNNIAWLANNKANIAAWLEKNSA
ncbi:uncharacterized protein LOC120777590 [Bactrocera tryoni]|uniref:uncharacterized protein LOC120777590 n=1 Tax=Bactrocera tryoni TaxID=59916 RepID=UPI001A979521|nr:uncharacterized protein LOC120777590 [Bactrocera tryoni]